MDRAASDTRKFAGILMLKWPFKVAMFVKRGEQPNHITFSNGCEQNLRGAVGGYDISIFFFVLATLRKKSPAKTQSRKGEFDLQAARSVIVLNVRPVPECLADSGDFMDRNY